jgi:hypothetical protein
LQVEKAPICPAQMANPRAIRVNIQKKGQNGNPGRFKIQYPIKNQVVKYNGGSRLFYG